MSTWALTYNGNTRTFDEWGFSNLTKRVQSGVADEVSFIQGTAPWDSSPVLPYKAMISILRDGTQWFYGRMKQPRRAGSGSAESISFGAVGPWWFLENLQYQQLWTVYNGTKKVKEFKSRVILFQAENGAKLSVRQQIRAILQYAIGQGAPIQIGEIDPTAIPPFQELSDSMCSEAISACLRWAPDCSTWFDYSTTPPTIHVRHRRNLVPVTRAVDASNQTVTVGNITEREDLAIAGVDFKFEREDTVNGTARTTITRQTAGSLADPFSVAVMTFELSGASLSFQRFDCKTEPIEPNSLAWWQKKLPWLANATNVTIAGGTVSPNRPRELVQGGTPPWLSFQTVKAQVKAKVTCTVANANGAQSDMVDSEIVCTVAATDLETLNYTAISELTEGESVPAGLAGDFWQSVRVPPWEGTITITDREPDDAVSVGRVLNLSGSNTPAWAAMNAQIQTVSIDVDAGTVEVQFGPPSHLSPQDLLEITRVNRRRNISLRLSERTTGEPTGKGAVVDGAAATPNENASAAPVMSKIVLTKGNGKINLDEADIPSNVPEVKLISIDYCDNGVDKKLLLLGAIYTP